MENFTGEYNEFWISERKSCKNLKQALLKMSQFDDVLKVNL